MLKVMTIVGTRPEIIKLSRVIAELDRHTRHVLVHTGQNYDYELNGIFFKELGVPKPRHYLKAADLIRKLDTIIDAGNFKGANEIENLDKHIKNEAGRYVKYIRENGYYSEAFTSVGTDIVDEIAELVPKVTAKFPFDLSIGCLIAKFI